MRTSYQEKDELPATMPHQNQGPLWLGSSCPVHFEDAVQRTPAYEQLNGTSDEMAFGKPAHDTGEPDVDDLSSAFSTRKGAPSLHDSCRHR